MEIHQAKTTGGQSTSSGEGKTDEKDKNEDKKPETTSPEADPKPNGLSQEIISFVSHFEGGLKHYNASKKEYTVFNNGIDNKLELTGGVVIGDDKNGKAYSKINKLVGRELKLGSKITETEYYKIYNLEAQENVNGVNKAIADLEIELNKYQWDSAFSFCWNCGTGAVKSALTKFKNKGGNKGYWEYIHDYTSSGGSRPTGLVKRRAEEMELFLTGDYKPVDNKDSIAKHREYNKKYGYPEREGE